MFVNLYDMEIIYEEAFTRWKEEVNDLHPGKGQALFQVMFQFSSVTSTLCIGLSSTACEHALTTFN